VRSNSVRDLLALALALLAAWIIGRERVALAERFHDVQTRSDAYLLPSVDQTYVASLGYRSALADLIFGHLLVSQGLHFQENRLFEFVGDYLDVVTRLDPKFRDPYRLGDTLLTMQPQTPPLEFYRHARRILEKGMKELPYDQELWASSGQFILYLAPPLLTDPAEAAEWREAGTRVLMRACDLVGSNEAIPYHCITAAKHMGEKGNREAVRQFLERVLNVTDDPVIQDVALNYIKRVAGEQIGEEVAARQARFRKSWQNDLPLSPRVEIGALGPRFDTAACAGSESFGKADCATSWRAWASSNEAAARH
jgi:hypothetical protein